jgi:hypothetical protein
MQWDHTEQAHIVERYRRPDLAHLQVEITVDDPGSFLKPYVIHRDTAHLTAK